MRFYTFSPIVVRGFPTEADILAPWYYPGASIVVNVCENKYPQHIRQLLEERKLRLYHLPLLEGTGDMGIANLLEAVRILKHSDSASQKVVVHCSCGQNRSRTVVEAYYYHKFAQQFPDEYHGYPNHLLYNIGEGHLPFMDDLSTLLQAID